jgi:hypothetical protein
MKYIKELHVDFKNLIKLDLSNNIETDFYVYEISDHKDFHQFTYFKYSFIKDNIINDKNLDDVKNFIDKYNPNNLKKIKNFQEYYNLIVDEYIQYLNNVKGIDLLKIDKEYFFKSPRYAYALLLNYSNHKISKENKSKLEEVIFTDIEYTCKYGVNVLKDTIPSYEKKLNSMDIDSFEITFYFKNLMIELINSQKSLDDKSKKFDELYEKSLLFRKALKYNLTSEAYNNFFTFHFWNKTFEDLILKVPELLNSYIENNYFGDSYSDDSYSDSESSKSKHFNIVRLQNLKEKIKKDPKLIRYFYIGNRKEVLARPENSDIVKTLMSDTNSLIEYMVENYFFSDLETLQKVFPGYQDIILKSDSINSVLNFFENVLRPIFLKKRYDIDYEKDKELFKKFKEYLYQNYKPLINKIAKNVSESISFARITGSPFEEGEDVIFKDEKYTIRYLQFLKFSLGKSLVPDYHLYPFHLIESEDEYEINDE